MAKFIQVKGVEDSTLNLNADMVVLTIQQEGWPTTAVVYEDGAYYSAQDPIESIMGQIGNDGFIKVNRAKDPAVMYVKVDHLRAFFNTEDGQCFLDTGDRDRGNIIIETVEQVRALIEEVKARG